MSLERVEEVMNPLDEFSNNQKRERSKRKATEHQQCFIDEEISDVESVDIDDQFQTENSSATFLLKVPLTKQVEHRD